MQTKKLHTALLLTFFLALVVLNGPVVKSLSGTWLDIPVLWWVLLLVGLGMGLLLRWIFEHTQNDENA